MRKISEFTKGDSQRLSEQKPLSSDSGTRNVDGLRQAAVIRLWTRMTQIYGHRWLSSMNEATHPTGHAQAGELKDAAVVWLRGLADLSLDQIAAGVNGLLDNGPDWPPTLPEFRKLCLGARDMSPMAFYAAREAAYQAQRKALALPYGTWAEQRARGAERVAELKAMLRGVE